MSRRPLIGMVPQTLPEIPGERPPCWYAGRKYAQVLRDAGAAPVVLPLLPDDPVALDDLFGNLDGVFLTGGADVDPAAYGEPRLPTCNATDPPRDAVELQLLKHAAGRNLPVLAVCRGLQVLNVAGGGTLYQDIASQVPAALKHDYFMSTHPDRAFLAHDITVKPGCRLADLLGVRVVPVNSLHHQAVKELAPGLAATAFAPDGVIEAVEGTDPERFVIAVQWHPEELQDQPGMRRLFAAFVEVASGM